LADAAVLFGADLGLGWIPVGQKKDCQASAFKRLTWINWNYNFVILCEKCL